MCARQFSGTCGRGAGAAAAAAASGTGAGAGVGAAEAASGAPSGGALGATSELPRRRPSEGGVWELLGETGNPTPYDAAIDGLRRDEVRGHRFVGGGGWHRATADTSFEKAMLPRHSLQHRLVRVGGSAIQDTARHGGEGRGKANVLTFAGTVRCTRVSAIRSAQLTSRRWRYTQYLDKLIGMRSVGLRDQQDMQVRRCSFCPVSANLGAASMGSLSPK